MVLGQAAALLEAAVVAAQVVLEGAGLAPLKVWVLMQVGVLLQVLGDRLHGLTHWFVYVV